MAKRIAALGEIIMRLSTPHNERFIQADGFDINYGGGEANVAVSLVQFGYSTEFITAVPDNDIGECAIASLRKFGVDTSHITRCGERLGIYFLEPGSSVRPSKVIYDRAHSSISTVSPDKFDLDEIFGSADWFHFSGITPALSDSAAALTKAALISAKKHGVTISCDINYRSKLWSPEKAREVMTELIKYADICIGTEPALDFKPPADGILTEERCRGLLQKMTADYGFRYAVSSLRESHSASDNDWSACIYERDTGKFYRSANYHLEPIVDRVGGGDAFTAGLICGLLDGKDTGAALEFGAAAAALKHTIPGDVNIVSRSEVEFLARGDSSGRVQR